MSSLFGFYDLDGGPIEPALLSRAESTMQRRGDKFRGSHRAGEVGVGFTANHPLEGSLFVHTETFVAVAADARLDNKQSLIEILQLSKNASFAEIITKAYLKWGQDCPCHVEGDFAFIIWDPRRKHLFGARDRLGLKQLLYHYSPEKVFGCATDAKTLFVHENIQARPSEVRLLDFFVGSLEGIDKTCTAYSSVSRLPPGHTLLLKNGRISISAYWALEPQAPSQLKTQGEFVEAFQGVLKTAVARRFDSIDTTGVMVSGGMDSSAAAAMAVKQFGTGVKGFSAVNSGDPSCVETDMIRRVNNHLGLIPNYIDLATPQQWLDDAQSGLANISDPFDSNMTLMRAVMGSAAREGKTVLVDGAWGDTVFAPGSHVRRHMRSAQFISAWQALRADRNYHSELGPLPPVYLKMLASTLCPAALKSSLAPLKYWRHAAQLKASLCLKNEFLDEQKLAERLAKLGSYVGHDSWRNPFLEAAEIVNHPYHVVARERYDRTAGHFGVIMRDPFTDVDLVSFCLSLPIKQKTAQGEPKTLLRQSMAQLLPEAVISRLSKEHLGFKFSKKIVPDKEVNMRLLYCNLFLTHSNNSDGVVSMTEQQLHNAYYVLNWLDVTESNLSLI